MSPAISAPRDADKRALWYRLQGHTYSQIANRVSPGSATKARQAVTRALAKLVEEDGLQPYRLDVAEIALDREAVAQRAAIAAKRATEAAMAAKRATAAAAKASDGMPVSASPGEAVLSGQLLAETVRDTKFAMSRYKTMGAGLCVCGKTLNRYPFGFLRHKGKCPSRDYSFMSWPVAS